MTAPAGIPRRPLLLGLWISALAAIREATDPETDLFWMAREGGALLHGGALRHADVWAWDPRAWDFVPTSPLWQLLLGGAWAAGRVGLIGLAWITIAATAAALAWIARRLGAGDTAIVAALIVTMMLAPPAWTARAALPAIALLLIELVVAHHWLNDDSRTKAVRRRAIGFGAATAATSALGMWLHNSWSGYAVAAAVAVALLAAASPGSRNRRLMLAGAGAAGALLGALCGPFGFEAWKLAADVAAACSGVVVEWSSPWSAGAAGLCLWGLRAVVVIGLLRYATRPHPDRVLRLMLFGMALAMTILGLRYSRFSAAALIVVMPLLACRISDGVPLPARLRRLLGVRSREPYWRGLFAALLFLAVPLSVAATPHAYEVVDNPAFRALPNGCRLFSADGAGSIAVLVRPEVRVWIDGRLDYWRRDRITLLAAVERGDSPLPTAATCVISRAIDEPRLEAALRQSPDWSRRATADGLTAWTRTRT